MDRIHTARRLAAGGLLLAVATNLLAQDPGPGREPRCVKSNNGQCTEWASPPPGYTWDDSRHPAPATFAASQPLQQSVPLDAAGRYYSDTLAAEADCERDGGDRMNCYVAASPRRCKQTAVSMVGSPADFQRTWTMCVRSCGTASAWGRTFGDCRR